MQSYLYDKSLNLYFGYKGRNSQVPNLTPHNLEISILGVIYNISDPTRPNLHKDLESNEDSLQMQDNPDLSKSEPPKMCVDSKEVRDNKKEGSQMVESGSEKKQKDDKLLKKINKKRKKSQEGKKSFWRSLISWQRKSSSDVEGMRREWEKRRLQKNIHIDKQIFDIAWFSYRKGFQKSYYSKLTTDSGWGCMIRSGQMLLFTVINKLIQKPLFYIIGRILFPLVN